MPPPDDSEAAQPAQVAEHESDVEEGAFGKATPSILSGYEAYEKLNMTRYRVRGDGSCWVYAVLACLRLLEHHDEKRTRDPSTRDCAFDLVCRTHAHDWLKANIDWVKGNTPQEEIDTITATILRTPTYTNGDRTEMSSYGTILTIMCLAGVFEINIIVWNSMRRSV